MFKFYMSVQKRMLTQLRQTKHLMIYSNILNQKLFNKIDYLKELFNKNTTLNNFDSIEKIIQQETLKKTSAP